MPLPARHDDTDVFIQLATRIPKSLHREIKIHCVGTGISVMEFVAVALEDKLRKSQPARRRSTK
jgi:predicted HicB family RNase H-like nuclease